jgi:hypothetical protein
MNKVITSERTARAAFAKAAEKPISEMLKMRER